MTFDAWAAKNDVLGEEYYECLLQLCLMRLRGYRNWRKRK